MGRLFGTDGVRGVAGRDLTAQLAMDLAVAGAGVLSGPGSPGPGSPGPARPGAGVRPPGRRAVAVVGRDPRTSGEFLEAAVVAGLASSGVDVLRLGVIPTPAVAYLTGALDADFGVMLSASHNPAPDNGIKFFARGGLKLPDEVEDEIERSLATRPRRPGPAGIRLRPGHRRLGRAGALPRPPARHAAGSGRPGPWRDAGGGRLRARGRLPRSRRGCCAGPAPRSSPSAPSPTGTTSTPAAARPASDALKAAVLASGADVGIAHDGDADRCLAVDADGQVIDGDQIIAVLALALKDAGALADDTVVVTVMSNLGLRLAMRDAGIAVVETPVGDRYLVAAMRDGKFVLGGEQSGHIILLDHATTGDGLLTSLHLLATVGRTRPAARRAGQGDDQVPAGADQHPGRGQGRWWPSSPALAEAVRAAEAELGDSGRVLVRPSGTEPVVRVMVEAVDSGQRAAAGGRAGSGRPGPGVISAGR